MTPTPALSRAAEIIAGLAAEFGVLSRTLFDHPETAFGEHQAVRLISDWLSRQGFEVEVPAGGMETAFLARSGTGSPRIAFIAEYDALPGIGHACGHNLIGPGAAVAAAAVRALLPDHATGTVCVAGTPAEEGGGGKVLALDRGLFDGIDAGLMFHPADRTLPWRHALAAAHLRVTFHGVAAHAAKNPQDGRNALAAMIQLFTAVDGLRQHIPGTARIHGIITNGGTAPNVVPDLTVADFIVREATAEQASRLAERFTRCAEGAALATGTTAEVVHSSPMYTERKNNHVMAGRLTEHLLALGVDVEPASSANPAGSSDIGNLSLRLPVIHPYVQIADRGTPGHSVAFRDAAGSPSARAAALPMITALAALGAELITDPGLMNEVRSEFSARGADIG